MLISLLFAAVLAAEAQSSATQPTSLQSGPEAAAQAWFDASQQQDWKRAAAVVDLNALVTFRNDMLPMLMSAKKGKSRDDVLAMFQVKSLSELSQLEPRTFFARLMQSSAEQHPDVADAMKQATVVFVGSVEESPDLTHLVYRFKTQMDSLTSSSVQVISVRRTAGRWYVLLTGEMKGMK